MPPPTSPSPSTAGKQADIPEPAGKAEIAPGGGYGIVATGIGGTGVVTLSQILATAAFLDGLQVTGLDQTGLSQKAGPVVSHLKLWGQDPEAPSRDGEPSDPQASSAVGEQSADLLLALDLLVAADPRHLARASADRTVTVASTSLVPTAEMVRGDAGAPDLAALLGAVRERSRPDGFTSVDTVALATALFGDSIAANLIALGAAYQAGALPLQASSIAWAIELNGVAVERNQAAFRAGRMAVHDPGSLPASRRVGELRRRADPGRLAAARQLAMPRGLDGPAAEQAIRHAAELMAYQNDRLAARYLDLVGATARAEAEHTGEAGELTSAVTAAFFHLLAYKDEYEVARLLPVDVALNIFCIRRCCGRWAWRRRSPSPPRSSARPSACCGRCGTCGGPRPTRSATPRCGAPSGASRPGTRPSCAPSSPGCRPPPFPPRWSWPGCRWPSGATSRSSWPPWHVTRAS